MAKMQPKRSKVSLSGVREEAPHLDCKIEVSGDVVDNNLKGTVEMWTDDVVVVIQQAYIEITGTASCSFTLDKTGKCAPFQKVTTKFKDSDDFYFARHTICGGEFSIELKNRQSFPFNCHWPSRMPGTRKSEFGSTKYTGKVTIKLLGDHKFTFSQEILVLLKRDLILEKHLVFEERKDFRRAFFKAPSPLGHVDVSVWIPVSGIAAGQHLPVLCTVLNHSEAHFGGLVFVLTRIDIYRSTKPTLAIKTVRTDICRVARMVDIHKGSYFYYAVLNTSKDDLPTNQFYTCKTCMNVYEVWVSLQGSFPRFSPLGYPNVDTPGLPLILGTSPIYNFNINEVTRNVLMKLLESKPMLMEQLPGAEIERLMESSDQAFKSVSSKFDTFDL